MNRGVIASPALIHAHDRGFTVERSISPQEIRYYALYWDKVVIPASNAVYIGILDEEVLIETGVIERPIVEFRGGRLGGSEFALAQSVVAKKLMEEDKSVDWVIHQFGPKIALPQEFLENRNSLRIDLVSLLPVPSGEVPIADVLEFKMRRADELNHLHTALEHTYLEVLKSPDPQLSQKQAMHDLQKSIANLNVVSAEKWERTSKFDFSAELNLDGSRFVKGIAAGAVMGSLTHGFSIPVASIIGGIASIIKFKAGYSASFKPAGGRDKLAYLSSAISENIVS